MVCLNGQARRSVKAHVATQKSDAHPVAPPTPSPPVLSPSPPVLSPFPPPFIYSFNQHHLDYGNGNYYWKGGHGPHLNSWPDVNHQLMSSQENWRQIATWNIIKNQNKTLVEKDAQIQELLAKVASLEAVTHENAHLRAKLHEFGDLEIKKQGLELQKFNLEFSKLVRAETENLKDQLEKSEKNTEVHAHIMDSKLSDSNCGFSDEEALIGGQLFNVPPQDVLPF